MSAAGFAVALALAPAVASADLSWQPLPDPAPRGDSIKLVDGVPYLVYAASDGVHVAKPNGAGSGWAQVGTPIRHTAGAAVYEPDLAVSPSGEPWVAWTETDAHGIRQARLARFSGGAWHEVVGGDAPINGLVDPRREPTHAFTPQLAFFNGRPYVVYIQDAYIEFLVFAVRLKTDGSAFEDVSHGLGAGATRPGHPRIAVADGRLYATVVNELIPGPIPYRFDAARSAWDTLAYPGDAHDHQGSAIEEAGGKPRVFWKDDAGALEVLTLGADGSWQALGGTLSSGGRGQSLATSAGKPYAAWLEGDVGAEVVRVASFTNGAWSQLPSPSRPGTNAVSARLAASGSAVYILWGDDDAPDGGGTRWHVARLVNSSQPAGDPGDSSGGGSPNPPLPVPVPVPVPTPTPTPTPAGSSCAPNVIGGTSLADTLIGTTGADAIAGHGGNDRLFGLGGRDCLFGSSGRDSLFGDAGDDRLRGGSGGDSLHGGSGADRLDSGSGGDRLDGGSGDDDLNGQSGNDAIAAGPGRDQVSGGAGNDRIDVRGGSSDLVDCGPGFDTVLVSPNDYVRRCERVIVQRPGK